MTTEYAKPVRTIALSCAVQAVGGGLGWSLVPPLMPQIAKDFSLSHAMGGVVWGAAPLGIALASPFGGAAVDCFGPRRTAAIALLVGAAACAARSFANTGWALAAAMLVFGLHIGFTAPAIPKALAEHVAPQRLARANGIALLGYTLGTAVTIMTAQTLILPLVGDWRAAMVFAGVAMAVVAGLFALVVRDRPLPARHASFKDVVGLAANGTILRVAAMQFLLFGGYLALLGLLPRALHESGLSTEHTGLAVGSWLVAAGVANVAGPLISEKTGRRRTVVLCGGAVAGASLLLFALVPQGAGLVFLAIAALGGGCVAPLLLAMPAEIPGVGPARAGAALGLLMLVGQIGGFLLPLISGAVAQKEGLSVALVVLALAHLAILVPAYRLRETGPRGPLAVEAPSSSA